MTTVRKMTKTTITLIIFSVGLSLLMRWCETLPGDFFYKMTALLNSKAKIGRPHTFLIPLSFWLLLIASGIDSVYREKSGVYAFGSFGVPCIFTMCVAMWGLVATSTRVNMLWFWLFYYAGLIICVRILYCRLSSIRGAGPSKIKLVMKSPPSKNDSDVSMIDRSVLYIAKIVILADWFALLITAIVFCVRHKQIFGL